MKIPGLLLIIVLSSMIAFPAEIRESNENIYRILAVDSLNRLAEMSMASDTALAKSSASRALEISVHINYIAGQITALSCLATFYQTQGEYLKTLDLYFKIIEIYEKEKDVKNMVINYCRLTQFFLKIKDFDLAEKYLVMLTRLAKKSDDPATHVNVNLTWAKYYLAKKENDLAIRFGFLALPYSYKAGIPDLESSTLRLLGDAFMQKKMYAKAEYNYMLAIACLPPGTYAVGISILYTRLAHVYQVRNNNFLNLKYNLMALRIREYNGPVHLVASSYMNVGEAYWLLGRKDSARYYLQKSLKLAEQIGKIDLLEPIYRQLFEFAKAEKKYADALQYYISRNEYFNKMSLEANNADILILEANRTIRATEAQNELLNQEIVIQDLHIRNRRIQIFLFEIVFIIMLALILIVEAVARKNRKRKNELIELNERLSREISIRIEAEGRLNRSKELHRVLAENTVDVISLMDIGLRRLYISPSCEKLYGYTAQEILRMHTPLELVDPAYHITVNQRLLEMFRSKNSTRFTYKALRKDCSTFWVEASINPILDPLIHEVKNLITVVRDISEHMKHEEELSENSRQKEYLLREIHNRVKNNFAILISLMNMQRDQSADSELSRSLTDLQLRVRTMSLVHEQLYQTQEINTIPFNNYLHHLALIISSSFDNSRIRLQTEIYPCKVNIEMALPLGLIMNELITNAYKYAFPGDKTGNIWVRLRPEYEDRFCIEICDDGIGLPQDFTMHSTQTMGSQIVGILVEQIEAKLEVSGNNGACFRILFSTLQDK